MRVLHNVPAPSFRIDRVSIVESGVVVFAAERNFVSCMIAWIERSIRRVSHRHGFRVKSGSISSAEFPGKFSRYGNQVQFRSGFRPHAAARVGRSERARSSAASGFGMALHYRCNLLVRGACGIRQVGCRRPSGQCAGTHEKGPPHLSRSCVARMGGRHHSSGSRAIHRMRRTRVPGAQGVLVREFRRALRNGPPPARREAFGSSEKDPKKERHRKTSGQA